MSDPRSVPLTARAESPPGRSSMPLADRAVLWAAAAVVIAMRAHVSGAALEGDECNYLCVASRLLAGDRLYVDVWDHQPPGVFWMFAGLVSVFGDAPAVLRWTATGCSLLSLVFLFDASRRCFGRSAAWLTALFFAIASTNPLMAGEGGNREVYMNALAAAAMWVLLRSQRVGAKAILVSGLCWALASLLKTVAAAQWLGVAVFLLLVPRDDGAAGRAPSRSWQRVALFAAAPVLVWAVTLVIYGATGRLGVFIDAAFAFNLGYSETHATWWSRFVELFSADRGAIFASAWPVWVFGPIGALLGLLRRSPRRPAYAAWACYAAGSYVAVCLPGRFWPHYYLLLWQPLVVLAAALGRELTTFFASEHWKRASTIVFGAVVGVALGANQLHHYLLVAPEQVGAVRYGQRMEWARQQGRRVAEVTDADDSIYVWGPDAGVYYYANRRCASRFTMNTALKGDRPGVARRRELLLGDLRRNRPVLILIVDPEFRELADLLIERYFLVGEDRDPADAARVRARVFVRKDRFDPAVVLPWSRPSR